MPRYSSREIYGDGESAYNDRSDAGEFSTYGQSRGPSSNAYADGMSHDGDHASNSFRRRQTAYDEDGYPMEGAYAGEQDLRRYISRATMGEPSPYTNPCRRLERDGQYAYEPDRRSRLSEQTYTEERESEMCRQREREQAERARQAQREQQLARRQARRLSERKRIDEMTARHRQQVREENTRDEEYPGYLRDYGRGYFPSYGYR